MARSKSKQKRRRHWFCVRRKKRLKRQKQAVGNSKPAKEEKASGESVSSC